MTTTYELYTNENGTPKAVEGKAPAIIERVEALEEKSDDCLPLAGGTMTGSIDFERGNVTGVSGTYAGVELNGNKNSPSNGATFVARAPDAQDLPNCAVMIARDGTNFHNVVLRPDGTFTKDGQTIFTSAGGTMTGTIDVSYLFAKKSTDDSELNMYGSTAENHGGRLTLYGQDSQWSNGGFSLIATNSKSGQWVQLSGEPDGMLTWGGKTVLTSDKDWTVSGGTNGWARHGSTGLTIQWGFLEVAGNTPTQVWPARSFTSTLIIKASYGWNEETGYVASGWTDGVSCWVRSSGTHTKSIFWLAIGFS